MLNLYIGKEKKRWKEIIREEGKCRGLDNRGYYKTNNITCLTGLLFNLPFA